MRRIRSACCARAASGHTAAPPSSVMNSRRLIASPEAQDKASYRLKLAHRKGPQPMSALGHKRTFAVQTSCPLYPQKRTCAVQLAMSALGQERTSAFSCFDPLSAKDANLCH